MLIIVQTNLIFIIMKMKSTFLLFAFTLLSVNVFSNTTTVDLSNSEDADALATAIIEQTGPATILLKPGVEYFLDGPKLNYALTIESQGEKGIVKIKGGFDFGADAPVVENLTFKNIELLGNDASGDYVSNWSQEGTLQEYAFEDCVIHSFRGAVRLKDNKKIVINKVHFNNSIVKNIGGYGLFNQDNGAEETFVNEAIISNTTIANVERILVSKNTFGSIKVSDCTFYKAPRNGRALVEIATATEVAGGITIENIILSEPLNGNPKAGIVGTATVTITNSYATTDIDWNSLDWKGAEPLLAYSGVATDLFTDVEAFNFKIIDENFVAKNSVGDPRYYFNDPVGIKKVEADKISYYLTNNDVVLDQNYNTIEVYSLAGNKISTVTNNSQVTIFESGVFLIKVVDNLGNTAVFKVVK